ncbi:hypothetical protein ASG77_07305 [Arthrobacter sp. Soil762]|nr:hypothetical protein ASG77_07305 [Arthrobacter sp. Soil762]
MTMPLPIDIAFIVFRLDNSEFFMKIFTLGKYPNSFWATFGSSENAVALSTDDILRISPSPRSK